MIKLRPYELSDVYDMLSWMNDENSTKYLGSGFPRHFTLDEGFERIEALINGDTTSECFVISDEADAYLGECSLMLPDRRAKKAEISVVLIPEARGRGAAYSALKLLIGYAFCEAGYERLYLKCAAQNTRALRLYEKLGFTTEGILRRDVFADGKIQDAVIMGLIKEEFTE